MTHPSGDDDNEDNSQLDDPQEVLQPQTPFQGTAVDEKRRGDTSQSNGSLVPAVDGHLGGVQDVFSEDDRVGSGPAYIDANRMQGGAWCQSRGLYVDRMGLGRTGQDLPSRTT
jgi:hypothetical protein